MKTTNSVFNKLFGTVPKKDSINQKLYESLAENYLNQGKVPAKLTEYIASDDASRAELLKTLLYNKREGNRRALDIAIKRKEEAPRTRSFTKQELLDKYIPTHERRGSNFNIKDEQRKQKLDSIFDDFEQYRQSSAFNNFKGDIHPKLSKTDEHKAIKELLASKRYKRKNAKLFDTIKNQYTDEFENALVKSKKKLYPDIPFEDAILTPQQMQTLKDFFTKRGKKIYKEPENIDSQQVIDALNRASVQKYANRPQKPIIIDEYDGYSFKDFMNDLDEY